MSPYLILFIIISYFLVLISISYFTSKNANSESFFLGNRKSPWYIVAFGMISASLSGVTFISVPGWVVSSNFSYMQMVLGYLVGYAVIANVLMPMYYRLNLTSIYTYLGQRFGKYSYKTGSSFFLLSRVIGASFRLFLVANVLQIVVFNSLEIPFWITVVLTIMLIWLYTFKGGIKTIIWTDSLQTIFMLLAVAVTIVLISKNLNLDFKGLVNTVVENEHSKLFYFDDLKGANFFLKQFFAGAFIAIVMTGLDQDMMQKNLSCKNIHEAKKNMYWLSFALVPVNLMFMSLGVLLVVFAQKNGIAIPERTDDLFPLIATQAYLSPVVAVFFIIGLVAAAYSSADSALTALTTSFTVDILNTQNKSEKELKSIRTKVHVGVSVVLVIVILIFNAINNESVISAIFKVAGYTYGPLLGMYAFGLFTKYKINDKYVPLVAIVSPIICFVFSHFSQIILGGYQIGFELLILNGFITFIGLLLIKVR
ncbi:MAG: sodium:solute symporter [Bacteroidales bacterium]|jgi:SSS family solute:Na+ symporter|nr:sodium:solute symporter [Bacteroidales bacterium]